MKFTKKITVFWLIFSALFSGILIQVANGQSGTTTNFQGPKGKFYGVEYNGQRWGGNLTNIAGSLHDFNTILRFDADGAETGKPNIFGEMTSIYLPADTLGQIKSWNPTNWLNQLQYLQNPIGNYTWQIGDKYYGMESWLCRWYIAFNAEWEGSINFWGVTGEVPPINHVGGPLENEYSNLAVWLEVNTKPTFYYQNSKATYFAIGKIQLSNDVSYKGTTVQSGGLFQSNLVEPRTTVSILPESAPSLLYMYDNPWGGSGVENREAYSYQGQALNPSVFRDYQYIKLNFNRFGVYAGSTIPWSTVGGWVKGDVAVVCFDVTVFSIGEWQVQDVQNDPDNYGRFVRTAEAGGFLSWLFSPATLSWLIPVIIFFLLLIFAPWVLVAIISIFRGR